MEPCHSDNIGAVKKGAVVGRRRDESVACALGAEQEFGGGLEVKNTVVAHYYFPSKTTAKDK